MQKRPKRKRPARIKVIFSFIFFSVSDACEPRPSKATRHRDLRLISKTLIGNLYIALRLTRARRALIISFAYLRLSRLDDYDEALRRKPKQAGSLVADSPNSRRATPPAARLTSQGQRLFKPMSPRSSPVMA
jgi:hypothetical protein